jgi:predicted ATPase/class 3 adenylate cyclase
MDTGREGARASQLPVGTLTFFRSDVEGSMELARTLGSGYDDLDAEHHRIVREAIMQHHGQTVRTEGDAVFAVFVEAPAAAHAAVAVQRAMAAASWPDGNVLKVRIGLHAGAARRAGDDYGGFEVSRAARIADLGWGGQTILSEPARALIAEHMEDDWSVRDLGRHRLKGVIEPEHVYQLDAAGLGTEFPTLRGGAAATEHLPERLTSFIGRESELEGLSSLLGQTRLLTLTGPGGTGKTTLAIELARRHATGYADGAWFIDLQGVDDVDGVTSEIAHGVGLLDGSAGPAAGRLGPYVAERELLIVIDNFEQVIEAAETILDILRASPRSRVIVTSRRPLRLSGEQEYAVRPLATRGEAGKPSEAVRLFVDRARRMRHDLAPDADMAAIRDICGLVDGLPLAIELAAARVSSLPISGIRDRLAEHLPLPGSGPRDLPLRQRTVEATIAWSHDLLGPALRRLLARLSIFEETFELEQAEVVCRPDLGIDVLEGLIALVDHSLVHRLDDAVGGIRFGMLETIRGYAAAALEASGEQDLIRARHMVAYDVLVERDWPVLLPEEGVRLIDRVEVDDANVRAAVTTAIASGEVGIALRMVGLLWRAWLAIGRLTDGRRLIEAALALPGAEAESRERIMALDAAGGAAYWAGELSLANDCYEEQLSVAEHIDDPLGIGMASINLYFCRVFGGDPEGAERALAVARRVAGEHDFGSALTAVDIMQTVPVQLTAIADPVAGRSALEEWTMHFDSQEDPAYQPVALVQRAMLAAFDGNLPLAARTLAASVRGCLAQRAVADAALYLMPSPFYALSAGQPEFAATMQGVVAAAFERLGIAPPMDLGSVGVGDPTATLVEALGRDAYDAAHERGRRMSIVEAADYLDQVSEELPDSGDRHTRFSLGPRDTR